MASLIQHGERGASSKDGSRLADFWHLQDLWRRDAHRGGKDRRCWASYHSRRGGLRFNRAWPSCRANS